VSRVLQISTGSKSVPGNPVGQRGRGRLALLLMGISVLSSVARSACAQMTTVTKEYRTKATFLATFPSFIDWPEDAFPAGTAPFLVCVVGDFQFGTSLAEVTRSSLPHGRRVEVRWVHKDSELRKCHILFVSRSEAKRYARVLQLVQGADVLTVGETSDFLSAGGALSFTFQNESLQFEVNLPAARDAHLRVSSKLLALARRVVGTPETTKG
jgi:YfiR/HmsC-like